VDLYLVFVAEISVPEQFGALVDLLKVQVAAIREVFQTLGHYELNHFEREKHQEGKSCTSRLEAGCVVALHILEDQRARLIALEELPYQSEGLLECLAVDLENNDEHALRNLGQPSDVQMLIDKLQYFQLQGFRLHEKRVDQNFEVLAPELEGEREAHIAIFRQKTMDDLDNVARPVAAQTLSVFVREGC